MVSLKPDCGGCRKVEPIHRDRIIRAVLANVEDWEDRLRRIEAKSPSGSKLEALTLLRDVEMARLSLARLIGTDD